MNIVLASTSPRRRALLGSLGLDFQALSPAVDEASHHPDSPRALVLHNAALKAGAGAARLSADAEALPGLVIGADTIVVLEGDVLGKPKDRAEALQMLERLSGRTHEVWTGLAFKAVPEGTLWLDAERSLVTFHPLVRQDIEQYVSSGEADDKAGAYGIQGMGGRFIAGVEGDLTNVIGLPLTCLARGFEAMTGTDPLRGRDRREVAARAFFGMEPGLLEFVR